MSRSRSDFRLSRFIIAIGCGALTQVVLLAFGLHASLFFGRLFGSEQALYWIANGLYMTVGIVLSLFLVPWAAAVWRAVASLVVLAVGLLIGLGHVI